MTRTDDSAECPTASAGTAGMRHDLLRIECHFALHASSIVATAARL
jgi:hypothetical protein